MSRASAGGTRPRWPPRPEFEVGIPVGQSEFIERSLITEFYNTEHSGRGGEQEEDLPT